MGTWIVNRISKGFLVHFQGDGEYTEKKSGLVDPAVTAQELREWIFENAGPGDLIILEDGSKVWKLPEQRV